MQYSENNTVNVVNAVRPLELVREGGFCQWAVTMVNLLLEAALMLQRPGKQRILMRSLPSPQLHNHTLYLLGMVYSAFVYSHV